MEHEPNKDKKEKRAPEEPVLYDPPEHTLDGQLAVIKPYEESSHPQVKTTPKQERGPMVE